MRVAFAKALTASSSSPVAATELINAALDNIKVDQTLDVFGLANHLRKLGSGAIKSWTMPATLGTAGNQSVLNVNDAQAQPVIDYFKGLGPEPAEATPTPGNAVPLAPAAPAAQDAGQQSCS